MAFEVLDSWGCEERLRFAIAAGSDFLSTMEVAKNANVYNCGEVDGNAYLIECGQIKTMMFDRAGKACLLSIYAAGDVFGEQCLADRVRLETATAMKATILKRISCERLLKILADGGGAADFTRYLALRLLEQQQKIANLVMMDSQHRLAAVLLQLGRKLANGDSRKLQLKERITQEDLAGMIGTTRSRVGYFLKRFHQAGLVERHPDAFLVINRERLTAYLDA